MSYAIFNEKLQHITFILELGQRMETDTIPLHHDKEDTRKPSASQADFNGGLALALRLFHSHLCNCMEQPDRREWWSNQTEGSGRATRGLFVDQASVSV